MNLIEQIKIEIERRITYTQEHPAWTTDMVPGEYPSDRNEIQKSLITRRETLKEILDLVEKINT